MTNPQREFIAEFTARGYNSRAVYEDAIKLAKLAFPDEAPSIRIGTMTPDHEVKGDGGVISVLWEAGCRATVFRDR